MATFRLWTSQSLLLQTDSPVLQAAEVTALQGLHALTTACEHQGQALVAQGQEALDGERQRGYQHGWAQGAAACTQKLLELERERVQWLANRQGQVVELVELVLERIAPALAEGQLVRALAHQAVQDARQVQRLLIKVHPDLVADMQADVSELRRICPWLDSLEVLGDNGLERDDCLLESPHGSIHAHWKTQLAALRAVLGELASPSNAS